LNDKKKARSNLGCESSVKREINSRHIAGGVCRIKMSVRTKITLVRHARDGEGRHYVMHGTRSCLHPDQAEVA